MIGNFIDSDSGIVIIFLKPLPVRNICSWIDVMPEIFFKNTPSKGKKNVFRQIEEIRMVECNHCWILVMCSWGLFTVFSLLCCIWKIYIVKKIKLCYFRGRILAKGLNCSLYLYNSGRVMATHSFSFSLPSFLHFFSSSVSSKITYWTTFCNRHYSGATSLTRYRDSYYSSFTDEETEA